MTIAPSEAPLPFALFTLTPTRVITPGRREGYARLPTFVCFAAKGGKRCKRFAQHRGAEFAHGALYASLDDDLLGRYGLAKLFTLLEATPWESVRKRSR